MPPSLIMTVRTGLSFMFDRSTARSIAAATSSAPAVTVGTKLTISASTRLSARTCGMASS